MNWCMNCNKPKQGTTCNFPYCACEEDFTLGTDKRYDELVKFIRELFQMEDTLTPEQILVLMNNEIEFMRGRLHEKKD